MNRTVANTIAFWLSWIVITRRGHPCVGSEMLLRLENSTMEAPLFLDWAFSNTAIVYLTLGLPATSQDHTRNRGYAKGSSPRNEPHCTCQVRAKTYFGPFGCNLSALSRPLSRYYIVCCFYICTKKDRTKIARNKFMLSVCTGHSLKICIKFRVTQTNVDVRRAVCVIDEDYKAYTLVSERLFGNGARHFYLLFIY